MYTFDADKSKLETGVWTPWKDDVQLLIAHISNLSFQRALSRYQQPHRKKIENGTIDPKINRDIVCKAMSEALLLDWRGVASKDTKQAVPYTKERGLIALTNDAELRDFVSEVATSLANYEEEEQEEAGNG